MRALALTALVLLLAACSGATAAPSGVASLTDPDGASADPAASPSASLDPEDAMFAFARCMREHGVDMPDPQVSGTGGAVGGVTRVDLGEIDQEAFQAAQEACGDLLAQVGMGPGASLSPEDMDRMVAFAACMREHGIDMPDPQTSGGAMIIGGGPGSGADDPIDPMSPEFQAAEEACRDLLPGLRDGGDGGPSVSVGG